MNQNLEQLKKKALIAIELSPDTKNQVINSKINQFQTDLKRICSKRNVIVLVLEN